jgi:glycosyltransferase involved in cell wall biosynthesis
VVLNISGVQGEQFENYVCYLHPPSDLEPDLKGLGVPVYGLGLTGKYQWIRGVSQARKLVSSLNIDLIHTNLYESDVIGGIAGKLSRRPVVSTLANLCFEPEFVMDNPSLNRFKLETARFIRGVVAHTCNYHLVSVSQSVAESAQRRLRIPARKTSIIYRGLSQQRLEPPREEHVQCLWDSLGLADCWPVLLNVGRLVTQKGQTYLIEAMVEVLKKLPKARLLIAGDGPLNPTLTQLRGQLGLEEQVTFLGQRDDVPELLEMADIFVFPSLFEGCPNALIEAMAMGKPCVASRIGPIEEVMEDGVTGLLVPAQSPEALAEGIVQLCTVQMEEGIKMGWRAKSVARQQFTIEAAVEKLENLYQKVLLEYYGKNKQPSQVGADQ